jgi:hypothetical protein
MSDRTADTDEYVAETEAEEEAPEPSGRGRSRFLMAVFALLVAAGGVSALFWNDLMHPFGDPRACDGSEAALPAVIMVGGAALPQDATDVRYYTHDGEAVVSFTSDRMPAYLVRAGAIPDTDSLFADREAIKYAMPPGTTELPEGLCGEGLRAPAWSGHIPPTGNVLVERAPSGAEELRSPARVHLRFRYADTVG